MNSDKSNLRTFAVKWRLACMAGEIKHCRNIEGLVARTYAARTVQRFLAESEQSHGSKRKSRQ